MLDDRGASLNTGPTQREAVVRGLKKAGRDLWYNVQRRPGRLIRYLNDARLQPVNPVEPNRTIWEFSEPDWQRWSRGQVFMQDWGFSYHYWTPQGFTQEKNFPPRLHELIVSQRSAAQTFDITDIGGMSASKSAEWEFDSIEAFARARCPRWIIDESEDNFRKMMKHWEIRLHNMQLSRLPWSRHGLYWDNSGGSHHMAAAIYLARKHGYRFAFQAVETSFHVDELVLWELDARWEILIIKRHPASGDLRTALRDYRCSHGLTPAPRCLFIDGNPADIRWETGNRMVLLWLDKHDKRAMTVASVMRDYRFVRFNPWLMSLAHSPVI